MWRTDPQAHVPGIGSAHAAGAMREPGVTGAGNGIAVVTEPRVAAG